VIFFVVERRLVTKEKKREKESNRIMPPRLAVIVVDPTTIDITIKFTVQRAYIGHFVQVVHGQVYVDGELTDELNDESINGEYFDEMVIAEQDDIQRCRDVRMFLWGILMAASFPFIWLAAH